MSGDAIVWLCIPDGSQWIAYFKSDRCVLYLFDGYMFIACRYQYLIDMCLECIYDFYHTVSPMHFVWDIPKVMSLV